MELAGSNMTNEQLEEMLERGEGAQLMGHIQIEGDADQLRAKFWAEPSFSGSQLSNL